VSLRHLELPGKCVHAYKVCIVLLKLNEEQKTFSGPGWLSSRNEGKASWSLTKVAVIEGGSDRFFPVYFTDI